MTITPASRLGPYEIVSRIGAGGMGEVWRARDTRLDRSVAIKVLSTDFAGHAELRARFDREARTISQLNHPNICTLYDVGHEDGIDFLVMELLEGDTLADRIEKGPLPLPDLLRYGAQIADALARAHRQSITHRDLKPANVMITKSGAKLLDFGLAKTLTAARPVPSYVDATQQKPLTQEGTVLGTFQYMAPEQLAGDEADARTDIFAFGALLYEMATGARAFTGKTRTSLVANIIAVNPRPISELQPLTPPSLERLIQRCLAKDPDDRWQSAADVSEELRWIAQSAPTSLPHAIQKAPRRRTMALTAGALLAGLTIGALAVWQAREEERSAVIRFAIPAAADAPIVSSGQTVVAISPDGLRIVYRAESRGGAKLFLRRLSEFTSRPIEGTERVGSFTFSPDGKSLAFIADQKLKRVSLDGGVPVTLLDQAYGAIGIDWYEDTIYYPYQFSGGIYGLPASGGKPSLVLKTDATRQMRAVLWPQMIRNGEAILATAWNNTSFDEAKIVVHSLKTGKTEVVLENATCARYVPSGHILFGRGDSLFAIAFDLESLRPAGPALPVINGITNGNQNGEYQYATSADGSLVYVPGARINNNRHLLWVDAKGEKSIVPTPRPYAEPTLSPDGRTIAVTLETSTFDIWQLDLDRDAVTRVSFGGDDASPVWTPDGQRIIWRSSRSGANNLYWAAADGSTGERRLTNSPRNQFPSDVSADGTKLLISEDSLSTRGDITILSLAADHKPEAFLQTQFDEGSGKFSPDSKWILYRSDESGRPESYIRPYPGPGGKWQVSTGGSESAEWSRDGRSIIYRQGTRFFRVPLEMLPRVRPGSPQLILDRPGIPIGDWEFHEDRFLRIKEEKVASAPHLYVVVNWFEELKSRFRTKS